MSEKRLIVRPIYTEKMANLEEAENKYAFRVGLDTNKIEIKRAIEKKFDVKVKSVRTMIVRGKMKQQMTRTGRFSGRQASWKKALVTLESGHKLELFGKA